MHHIAVDADEGDGQGDHLGHEAQAVAGPGGVKLDAHRVGQLRLPELPLVLVVPHLDVDHGPGGHVVDVAVVKSELVRHPGLPAAVDKVVVEQPEPDWFNIVNTRKYFNTVH